MQAPRPHRPFTIRLINGVGRTASRLGLPRPRLDAEDLLATARKQTGLEDFGPASFRPGFHKLLESFEKDAALTMLGRVIARGQALTLLVNRLRLTDHRRRHPEIDHEQIRQPLFVLGLPRTGTTFLYELLAQDPAHRSPQSWEVASPCPPPEAATYDSDPRIKETDQQLRQFKRLVPGFDAVHPMGARLPQECAAIFSLEFHSIQFQASFNVPSYQEWLDQQDMRPVYRFHRRFLQHLQSRCPAERWVLKTPGHLAMLDALLDEYPDALIVQTHRDPMEVLASVGSLECMLRGAVSDDIDPLYVGRQQTELWSRHLARNLEARARHADRGRQFFDVHFRELLEDPIDCVRRIYRWFGLDLTREAEQRMQRFFEENPRDKHGVHRYAPQTFGIDPARDAPLFEAYCKRFGVERGRFRAGEPLPVPARAHAGD